MIFLTTSSDKGLQGLAMTDLRARHDDRAVDCRVDCRYRDDADSGGVQ